ncbi:exonuclease domain-containing protein [Dactylosporangium sp. NPDC005572]|uniref:DEAD/DEAH box helicase n=1 Tax=Dactylosporangium sp. NPDC005572 TaxID=3156889 RepID=UPI0033A92F37
MTGPVSQRLSTQFGRLHPAVQRWVYDQGWRGLRDVQERAVAPILAGDRDVILAAATASGKTEAAWLPIASALLTDPDRAGVTAVYIGPLKALINDQRDRLTALFGDHNVAVHRWHGDVPQSQKQQVLRAPSGVLLITPESLEALFVLHGGRIATLFAGLQHVVVDELHSFVGTERGAQLQSLLHRLELVVRRAVPRVGLSATLGDFTAAADFLRPGRGPDVVIIESADDSGEIRLQLRGYVARRPSEGEDPPHEAAIAQHLFETLRGSDNLVFANSRAAVEHYTDRLTRMSERLRVPNEFLPHHGNLAKDIREHVEARLKDRSTPVTAVCTSTLEMGIDIGSVDSVAQIGPPHHVAALRQRLGRSGRRGDQPAVLRMYIAEQALDGQSSPIDALRVRVFQAAAVVDLLLARWYEPPDRDNPHLSTLIQQVLSVVAQRGGAHPAGLFEALCGHGPFARVDRATFAALLRAMGAADLLVQDHSGLLLAGGTGDRLINHYTFYAAFRTVEEYRLIAGGRTIGTLPVDHPIAPGMLLIFSGRRWEVVAIDGRQKVIDLRPSAGGRVPPFAGGGGAVADAVRRRMLELYRTASPPRYLDAAARALFEEGSDAYRRFLLDERPMIGMGRDTLLFPWRGDKVMGTLALALTARGLSVGLEGPALSVRGADPAELRAHLAALAAADPPSAIDLAALAGDRTVDKYDDYLSDDLAILAHAARAVDVSAAWDAIRELANATPTGPDVILPAPATAAGATAALGRTPFAAVDVETTGFAAQHHDRIVEIAVVKLDPAGEIVDRWTTLVNPGRDAGPTHTHGLTDEDLRSAPHFAAIARSLAERLDGHILVAHNARFDVGFLEAEYRRLGLDPHPRPTICTLELADRLGSGASRRLADCCAAAKIPLDDAHTALGDATATAALFRYALRLLEPGDLAELGCRPASFPVSWLRDQDGVLAALTARPAIPRSGRRQAVHTPPIGSLAGIAARVGAAATGDHRGDAYLDVLDRSLRDGMLTDDEGAYLLEIARSWGLGAAEVERLNARYLAELGAAAPADPATTAQLVRLAAALASQPTRPRR